MYCSVLLIYLPVIFASSFMMGQVTNLNLLTQVTLKLPTPWVPYAKIFQTIRVHASIKTSISHMNATNLINLSN